MASDWLAVMLPANLKPCWKIVVRQHGLHGDLISLEPLVNMWFYITLLQTDMMHTFEYLPHSSQYNMVGSHYKKAQYVRCCTFCCCLYQCCLVFFLLFLLVSFTVPNDTIVYQFPCLWIIGRLPDPIFYRDWLRWLRWTITKVDCWSDFEKNELEISIVQCSS